MLLIENVPGSEKMTIAINIFVGCLHSSLSINIRTTRHVDKFLDNTENNSIEPEVDEKNTADTKKFSLRPTFSKETPPPTNTTSGDTAEAPAAETPAATTLL